MQHGQTIRLIEGRGDLGEPAVRSVADGTRDVIAHGVTEALLDLVREGRGDIAGRHRGGELVNGAHGINGEHVVGAARKAVVYQWEARKRCPSPVFWQRIDALCRTDDARSRAAHTRQACAVTPTT